MSIKKNNTYFKENDGKVYYYDINGLSSAVPDSAFGTLKENLESVSGNLQEQIDNIGSPLVYSGTKTVEEINALENIKQGTVYTMSNSGAITAGDIEVEQSDEIAYADGWVKIGKDFQKELSAGTDLKYEDGVFSVNTNGTAKGECSFVEGKNTFAAGLCDHVEGMGGIADNGGMNHIEGFQYHNYCSNGPATNFNNTNIVRFPNIYPVRLRNNDTIYAKLYELVKIFKDRFIVSCEYGGGDGAGIFHYTQNSFYNPELYKIIDVDLDSLTNEILITIDGIINVPGTSNGSIQLYGPTTIEGINGPGGPLSSGQTLNTFIFNGGLGFPGNCLDNVRLDNTFISISLGYAKTGEETSTYVRKIIEIKNIEFDSSNNSFTFTTEDIEIPDIVGGGYSLTLYVINSTYYGCNHIEGQDNSIYHGCNSHAEGFCNTITNSNSHAEGNGTSAFASHSHTEGYQTYTDTYASYTHAEGIKTSAMGAAAHVEGSGTSASKGAHAEGIGTYAQAYASHTEGKSTTANGEGAHAGGLSSYALGFGSFAHGNMASAVGKYSFAVGNSVKAYGDYSHAEGDGTRANSYSTHAEGNGTTADGSYSHAEGRSTNSIGSQSHAEGEYTQAIGDDSHTEGYMISADGTAAHAEGYCTLASGTEAHAEGYYTVASGNYTHAEGNLASAFGEAARAAGTHSLASGNGSVAEGWYNSAYNYAHAEGGYSTASGDFSHAEGYYGNAVGDASHVEGYYTSAIKTYTHSEGSFTIASGTNSHSEGYQTSAIGDYSHTEGWNTKANGTYAHAEGNETISNDIASHAEGQQTSAIGSYSHTEGNKTLANANYAHAEGCETSALYEYSHAEGYRTIANYNSMHVGGKYNKTSADALFVIGNGVNENNRSDAFIVDVNGVASAKTLKNADGVIPTIIPTAAQPADTTACSLYVDANGKFYIVTTNS